jgi:adenosylhomocysteine nucleosidase
VVNFGSAGSRKFPTGAIVACNAFVQRDMDITPLGFDAGVTPFEEIPARIEFPVRFLELPQAICGTGDSFDVGRTQIACDVVDMEAYAFAKVCLLERCDFACAKYITDGADHSAAGDWQINLPKEAAEFLHLYRTLIDGRG